MTGGSQIGQAGIEEKRKVKTKHICLNAMVGIEMCFVWQINHSLINILTYSEDHNS